jgi:hypothetical protein
MPTALAPLLTQGDVERRIMETIQAMEDATDALEVVSQEAAEAEADYKGGFARSILAIAAGARVTAQEREARATVSNLDALRTYRIKEASRNSTKEHLNTLRAKLDGLRTIASNIRGQS